MAFAFISEQLVQLGRQNLTRSHSILEGGPGISIQVAGEKYLNFSSNDYLGLSQHPEVKQAFIRGVAEYGTGSTASAVVIGHSKAHQQLNERLCDWTGREAALLFNSGFDANSATLAALVNKNDFLCLDKLSHASLIDAGLNSKAEFKRFNHNDTNHLQKRLKQNSADNKLIVTEGVFSMDGDMAPLTEIVNIGAEHAAWLMLDDAHGLGVLGEDGAGSLQQHNIANSQCQVLMATFGKALGVAGAFVSGSQQLIDYLTNKARHHIYSTAFPPAQAVAVSKSIDIARKESWRRDKLKTLIQQFRQGAKQLGLPLAASERAIQPIVLGSEERALNMATQLRQQGVWVTAIRPPTVPQGTARLRITLSAAHSEGDLNKLLAALENCNA